MNNFCSFEEFYTAVTGHTPYLWQIKAAESIGDNTPEILDVGTGLGKTSMLHAWLWAFAREQHRIASDPTHRRRVPTRFHLVVDRRILVDSAADVADGLAAALDEATDGPVKAVADAIAHLASADGTRLSVRRLRGGQSVKAEHLRDPKVPAVVTTTIDALGSRLLWRGYGLSRGRRSIDAALVGADSLIVLDEAHLVPQFRHLVENLSLQTVQESGLGGAIPARQVCVMTATQTTIDDKRQRRTLRADLDAERAASPYLDARMRHRDDVEVTIERASSLVDHFTDVVLSTPPSAGQAYVVFVNQVKTARDLRTRLAKAIKTDKLDLDVEIVIGGTPEVVRASTMTTLSPYLSGDERRNKARGLIVVSTQSLEVGADLDFDRGWSELTPMSALIQRAGRVNRLGVRETGSFTVVVNSAEKKSVVYDETVKANVAKYLDTICKDGATMREMIDGAAGREDLIEQVDIETLVTMTNAELVELTDTHNEVTPVRVGPFIRPDEASWTCSVVFRDDLGLLKTLGTEAVETYLSLAPIHIGETWSLPTTEVVALLKKIADKDTDIVPAVVIERDRTTTIDLSVFLQSTNAKSLLGCTVVIDANTSFAKHWIPGFGTDVSDSDVIVATLGADFDLGDPDALDALIASKELDPEQTVSQLLDDQVVLLTPHRVVTEQVETARRVSLSRHNAEVGDRAAEWARLLGLPESIRDAIEIAGHRHDLGKCDEGFQYQLSLVPGPRGSVVHEPSEVLLGKSALPRWLARTGRALAQANGLRDGFRHEARSVVESRRAGLPEGVDADLVDYLIATHHGHFHGLGPTMTDPGEHDHLQDARHRDWIAWADLVVRVRTLYGPYSLALAESLIRLADWECSAMILKENA